MPETHTRKLKIWSVGRNKDVGEHPARVVDEGPEDRIYPEYLQLSGKNPNTDNCIVLTDEHGTPIAGAQKQSA